MHILITAGPTLSPLDAVRHIANRSTGTLGAQLAQMACKAGHDVLLLRSVLCSCSAPMGVEVVPFDTHPSLLHALQSCASTRHIDAVWHIAAVGDFIVEKITSTTDGVVFPSLLQSAPLPFAASAQQQTLPDWPQPTYKLDSRCGPLQITLTAAPKILPQLPDLFPRATIVGWKYEVGCSRQELLQRGLRQLHESRTAACVLNGPAWGKGWALLRPDESLQPATTVEQLYDLLLQL